MQPWQLLLLILAGWINHREQEVIEYLRTENRVLREKLGKKRILLNDDHRRHLPVKGRILGRKMPEQLAAIVTLDTMDSKAVLGGLHHEYWREKKTA